MNVLAFTMRSFPHIEELNTVFPNLFVLGKIKRDIETIIVAAKKNRPDLIVGVAKSESTRSRIETKAVNSFHKNMVSKLGPESIDLYVPATLGFATSQRTTQTFCNYAAYRTALRLSEEDIDVPVAFLHVAAKDITKLSVLKD